MRRRHLLPVLAVTVSLLAGCGETTASPEPVARDGASPQAPTTAQDDAGVRLVDEDEALLHLWISNQSFVDDPVRLTVLVDGVELVDQQFDVEGQHNWQLFPVALPAGVHELEAVSDTGARLVQRFRSGEQLRFAVLNYWNDEDEDGRFLDWMIQDDPVAFA